MCLGAAVRANAVSSDSAAGAHWVRPEGGCSAADAAKAPVKAAASATSIPTNTTTPITTATNATAATAAATSLWW